MLRLEVGGHLALPLVASVLEPDLDLRLGEAQQQRQPAALGARQVALRLERRLELLDLATREHRPRLLAARRRATPTLVT